MNGSFIRGFLRSYSGLHSSSNVRILENPLRCDQWVLDSPGRKMLRIEVDLFAEPQKELMRIAGLIDAWLFEPVAQGETAE